MTAFVLLATLLALLTAALLTRPFWWGFVRRERPSLDDQVTVLGRQLKQLKELHETGALADDQYPISKTLIERKLVAALSDASSQPDASAHDRRPKTQTLALSAFIALTAGCGYFLIGSPASLALGPGVGLAAGAAAAGSDPAESAPGGDESQATAHPLTSEQIGAMVEQLSQRLKKQPDDGDGWFMLARSYVAMGRHEDALPAFKQAVRLRPEDPEVLVDFADALAVVNNRSLDGEPTRLVERALKKDPANMKALALAGTAAFDRKDYAAAVKYWDKAQQAEPADSAFARQLQGSLAEARQLAGLPATVAKAPESRASSPAAAAAHVSGTVSLAPALTGKTHPDDTVFIFARAVEGPRMPLAILRKRVSDLPVEFTLDESMAMTPAATLSKYPRVLIGARISKTGDASARVGDLQGTTPEVVVGANGVKLVISDVVTK